jgi:hypothetical protein
MPVYQSTTVLCYHIRMKDISVENHYESLKQSASTLMYDFKHYSAKTD